MPDTNETQGGSPVPMMKEETVKDDGRTLIYYTFPADEDVPDAPAPEAAHV